MPRYRGPLLGSLAPGHDGQAADLLSSTLADVHDAHESKDRSAEPPATLSSFRRTLQELDARRAAQRGNSAQEQKEAEEARAKEREQRLAAEQAEEVRARETEQRLAAEQAEEARARETEQRLAAEQAKEVRAREREQRLAAEQQAEEAPSAARAAAVASNPFDEEARRRQQRRQEEKAQEQQRPQAQQSTTECEVQDPQPAPTASSRFEEAIRRQERLRAEREAQREEELEAHLLDDCDAQERLREQRLCAEREAQREAELDARLRKEWEAQERLLEQRQRKEREARRAEREAQRHLEEHLRAEWEAQERLLEVRQRAEREAQRAEREAQRTEREAQRSAEPEAPLPAGREAQRRLQEQRRRAAREARHAAEEAQHVEREAQRAEHEAQERVEREARLRAEREAQRQVELEAHLREDCEAQERFHEELLEECGAEEEPRPAEPEAPASAHLADGVLPRRERPQAECQAREARPEPAPANRFEEAMRRQKERAHTMREAEEEPPEQAPPQESLEQTPPGAGAGAEAADVKKRVKRPAVKRAVVKWAGVKPRVVEAEAAPHEPEVLETALFDVDGKVLEMKVRPGMTPHEIAQVWEEEWGVSYASRLKFEAPKGSGRKWLNAREDPMPTAPAEVRLSGIGSILRSVRLALTEHGGGANAPPDPPPEPRDGPLCPGTYVRVNKDAALPDLESPDTLKLLGFRPEGLPENDFDDEPSPEPDNRRRVGPQRPNGVAGDSEAEEEEEEEEENAPLMLVFQLVDMKEAEAKAIISKMKLKDFKQLAGVAKTVEQAKQLAKGMGMIRAVQQARFAEAWRRCSLQLLGHQKEYPKTLVTPAFEVDFAEKAVQYLLAVKDAMNSEAFAVASRQLIEDWKRRKSKPSSEDKMIELADMVFKNIHSQLLALFGFYPDNKGRKAAQAKIRQIGKDSLAVRELDGELLKMSMQRFDL